MIGRTKTVIVLDSGDKPSGVVSEVIAKTSSEEMSDRLVFKGPVKFREAGEQHLKSNVLPILDRITDALDVPRRNYEISVVNLGATAAAGIGVEISGFSADLPVLLALLSASLQMPLKQDTVSTGHVSSMDGDLAPVRAIPAKLEAAVASSGISAFALPALDKDSSYEVLTPTEYRSAKEGLLRYKGDIKILTVRDIHDAVKIFVDDEAVVLGGLESGFFDKKPAVRASLSPVSKTVALLTEDNEKRFWDVLSHALLNRGIERGRQLLEAYAGFHVRGHVYPERFGEQLHRLVVSLPPATRRLDDLFPLLPMDLCIALTQHASKSDHEDVRRLYKAAFGEGLSGVSRITEDSEELKLPEGIPERELLERLLSEISQKNLAKKVGEALDKARVSYASDAVTVGDGFEFNEAITAFYAHVFRHIASPKGHLNREALMAEAMELVERAFSRKGGYKAALAEGEHGINGGMRLVFDAMTEYLKQEKKEKYITRIFKEALDPLDWDARVRLMEAFKERIGPTLPSGLSKLPAKQLASHWELIVRYYVESLDKVSELLKRL